MGGGEQEASLLHGKGGGQHHVLNEYIYRVAFIYLYHSSIVIILSLQNRDGNSAIHIATTPEFVKLFVAAGADIDAKNDVGGG